MKKENFDTSKSDNSSTYIPYIQIYNNKIVKKDSLLPFILNGKQNQVLYGDILITISSENKDELGFSSIYLDDFCCYLNSFCFGIRLKNEFRNSIYQEYINIYFSSYNFRKKMFNISQGSTRYNLPKTDFLKFSILIPSINEQIKISKFFSLLDKNIKLWERKLQLYLLKKKYYLNSMFSNDASLPFLRFKGFNEKIISCKLEKIVNNLEEFNFLSNLFWDAPSILKNKPILFNGQDFKKSPENSIIFIKDGSNAGTFTYCDKNSYIATTCDYFCVKINALYVYYFLKSREKHIKNNLITGETIPHLYKKHLFSIIINFVNDKNEQIKISKFLSLLDKNIKLSQENIDNLKIKKLFYINKMFI